MQYTNDNVNQKTYEQVVGTSESGISNMTKQQVDKQILKEKLSKVVGVSKEEFYSSFTTHIDGFDLTHVSLLKACAQESSIPNPIRTRALATMLPNRKAVVLKELETLSIDASNIQTYSVPRPSLQRSAPVPITGPRAVYPPDEATTSVNWPAGLGDTWSHGPSRTPKKGAPPTPLPGAASFSGLHSSVRAPVYDLADRNVMRRIASYKKKVQTVTPKDKRADLVRQLRDYKAQRDDPWRDCNNEAQMNINLTHELAGDVKELLNRIATGMGEVFGDSDLTQNKRVNKLTQFAVDLQKGVQTSLTTVMDTATRAITKMLWVIPLMGAAYYALSIAPELQFKDMALGLSALLAVILPGGLWDIIKEFWPTKRESSGYEAQFGFQPDTLAHILTLCLTYMTIGKSDITGMSKDFMRSMGSYSRSVSGWKDLSGFIISMIEAFINFIREHFSMDKIAIHRSGEKLVDNWCARVMTVVNESHTGGDLMTPDNVRLMIALRNEGTGLTNQFRLDRTIAPILHKYLGHLDDICKICAAAMHMAKGGRPPPVVLSLVGAPGVGKTSLTKLVTSCVMAKLVSETRYLELKKNFDSEVFQKGTTEYWNGYCGQTCIVVDDFAQSIPVTGGENDYIDLIRMHSSWAYPLNFADLENKGKNFFCSKFILLTMNKDTIDSCQTVIEAPGAIIRRMDYSYKVSVHPDFSREGKIDFEKVEQYSLDNNREIPYHAWILHKHTFGIGSEAKTDYSKTYNLRDVIDIIADKIHRNDALFESGNAMVARATDAIYAKRKQEALLTQMSEVAASAKAVAYEAQMFNFSKQKESFNSAHCKKPATLFSKMNEMATAVTCELHGLRKQYSSLLENPIVQLCACAVVVGLFAATLRFAAKTIFNWFQPAIIEDKVIHRALLNKTKVPKECLAQMLDASRPTDFDTVEEVDGSYRIVTKFTAETIKKIYQRMTGSVVGQSNEPCGPKFVRTTVTGNQVHHYDYVAQADIYGSDIAEVVRNNQYQFKLTDGSTMCILGQILFVRDTVALIPTHFDAELKAHMSENTISEQAKVVFTNATNARHKFEYTLDEFLEFERASLPDDDVMMVKFPRHLRAQRDISKFFLTDTDLRTLGKARIRLDTVEGTDKFVLRTRHMAATRLDSVPVKAQHHKYILATGFEYLGYTKYGDCGGTVCLEEAKDKMCRRIVGIHVAGDPTLGLGFCNILTNDKINILLARLGTIRDTMFESQIGLTAGYAPIEGSFMGLAEIDRGHNLNPMSCIVKTKLHNQWGQCKRAPVPLRPFTRDSVKINPMVNALKPYSGPVIAYNKDDVARAAHHAFSKFRSVSKDDERRLYTFEEACAGIDGTDINGVPRNTAPGYPWVLDGITNKKIFFGGGDEYTFTSPECILLRKLVTECLDLAREGVRSPHVFVDFLKDELRSFEKVQAGMARLISSSPLVYTIAFRMMFMSFTASVQRTRIRNGIAVGINPYTEWDYLYRKMTSKGPHCVAGDFKQFDSSEQPDIHWAILDEINAWYNDGPVNGLIRQVLWMEVVHSRHLGGVDGKGKTIYQWNKSLPSGHPATSIINSFYNLTLFCLVWIDIFGIGEAANFWVYVYICVYGDDNVLNIHPDYIDRFNQKTIASQMALRGMTYTTEDKTSEVADSRTIYDISFLKRMFRHDEFGGKVVGPQELDSILHIPYWSKNKNDMEKVTLANVEFTYQELSLHGQEKWDLWTPLIKKAVKESFDEEPAQYFTRKEYFNLAKLQTNFWPI